MTRYLAAFVVLCIPAIACRSPEPAAVASKEPPPPLIEPQAPQAFTVAAPFQVDMMTNVAVR